VPATLWTADQIADAASGDPPWDWLRPAFHAFTSTLLNADLKFPCIFGASAQAHGHNTFTVLDSRLPRAFGLDALAESLLIYRDRAWSGPRRQSLIAFLGPPENNPSLTRDRDRFWRLLTDLHALDPAPWPEERTRDPGNPKWDWCFAGEPWFTFMCSPAYIARRSRNIGPCLTAIFQTRRIFHGLSGNTPAGHVAKQTVRNRLAAYEDLPPHPHLGPFDQQSDYKWRQYALPDDLTVFPVDGCPFEVRSVR
jgi:FPC/CPF motif-containing protein YcgG